MASGPHFGVKIRATGNFESLSHYKKHPPVWAPLVVPPPHATISPAETLMPTARFNAGHNIALDAGPMPSETPTVNLIDPIRKIFNAILGIASTAREMVHGTACPLVAFAWFRSGRPDLASLIHQCYTIDAHVVDYTNFIPRGACATLSFLSQYETVVKSMR